jgi:hypothetical protein
VTEGSRSATVLADTKRLRGVYWSVHGGGVEEPCTEE